MQISIIAAIGSNNELGANNQLLWHLPIDFKWFIAKTKGKPVIMGRKTMESLGKPLKNRVNIVLSRQLIEVAEGFVLVNSWDQAFEIAKQSESEEIMIIGGAQIYEQALEFANRIYLTHVDGNFENADTFFPSVNYQNYTCSFVEDHNKDDQHQFDFSFKTYERNLV
jgi:dihydrofolate reductase